MKVLRIYEKEFAVLLKRIFSDQLVSWLDINESLKIVVKNPNRVSLDGFDFVLISVLISMWVEDKTSFTAKDIAYALKGNRTKVQHQSRKGSTITTKFVHERLSKIQSLKIVEIDGIETDERIVSIDVIEDTYVITKTPLILIFCEKLNINFRLINLDILDQRDWKFRKQTTVQITVLKYFIIQQVLKNKKVIVRSEIFEILGLNDKLFELYNQLKGKKINFEIYSKRKKRLLYEFYVCVMESFLSKLVECGYIKSFDIKNKYVKIQY